MNNLDEFVYINKLLDLYGNLLTDSQSEIMNDYYVCNLSLSEISELRNITRTAVSDSIKKTRQKLEHYEEKLGLLKTFESIKEDKNNVALIEQIEERIKNGIWITQWTLSKNI